MSEDKRALIALRGVAKLHRKGQETIRALDGIDLDVEEKGMVAIIGASGSGKSSLLHVVGAMDRPSFGEVCVAGRDLNALPESALTRFRRQTIGFVFQAFNLIPNLTALENVMLPMEFNGLPASERSPRAGMLLEGVGLGKRLRHRPRELSGGEQQRVAIARALANDPPLVLADEPTGNLDSKTGHTIYELLREIARDRTVLVVTHAGALAQLADRVVHMSDGRIQSVLAGHLQGREGDHDHGRQQAPLPPRDEGAVRGDHVCRGQGREGREDHRGEGHQAVNGLDVTEVPALTIEILTAPG